MSHVLASIGPTAARNPVAAGVQLPTLAYRPQPDDLPCRPPPCSCAETCFPCILLQGCRQGFPVSTHLWSAYPSIYGYWAMPAQFFKKWCARAAATPSTYVSSAIGSADVSAALPPQAAASPHELSWWCLQTCCLPLLCAGARVCMASRTLSSTLASLSTPRTSCLRPPAT